MSTSFITSIDGKKCTAVAKNVNGGQATTTSISTSTSTTSTSTSTSTSTTSTSTLISISTSISTTFSTSSAPVSTPESASITLTNSFPINAPNPNTSASTTQETLTTTTSASDVSSGASGTTSEIVLGSTATTTTAASGQVESSNAGSGLTNGAENNVSGGANSTQTTVAVAGGVIGGLALISLVAFLFWFWRKRLMKKRRSTLLTPLSTDATYRGREKDPYPMSRNSLGPTTIPEKVRAVVGYNYQKLRGRVNSLVTRSPKPSVNLNRGNSQFGLPDTPANRSPSRAGLASNEAMTAKGRFVDWWGRLIEDSNFNWKLRNDPKSGRPSNDTYTTMSSALPSKRRGSQPDFLTLLSIEEKQQRRGSTGNNAAGSSNPRRSQSLGNDHFLGGLGLNFDTENPFADSNAMSHDSAKVMPLAVSAGGSNNPFSDANAIPAPMKPVNNSAAGGPTTYVHNIRRSRGYSTSAANTQPSSGAAGRMPSVYRESSVSVETSDTRRIKFRSDPFDLDEPELLPPPQRPEPDTRRAADNGRDDRYGRQGNGRGPLNMPRPTHARNASITSRYSSGVSSMGEWSDPGPDVGPAAGRWFTPSPDSTLGRQPTSREKDKGGRSQQSVGKAM
ncbi:hypothetical protein F5Y12DRAFT_585051 [Xylaria sp. FL1777]|nr:hypothetical protein F5Y12DRAFT_585051 [Xylaria sp. FL1777]